MQKSFEAISQRLYLFSVTNLPGREGGREGGQCNEERRVGLRSRSVGLSVSRSVEQGVPARARPRAVQVDRSLSDR